MTMVGREPGFARLVELLSSAESATGGFAVVTGEAGIGRTRLVTDWAALAGSRGGSAGFRRLVDLMLPEPVEGRSSGLRQAQPAFLPGLELVTEPRCKGPGDRAGA
jgi:hypothetical protein